MKIKRFTLLVAVFITAAITSFSWFQPEESQYFPVDITGRYTHSADGYLEYMQMIKADKQTGVVDPNMVLAARKQVDQMPASKTLGLSWSFKGPDNIGGRTRALLVDKNNPDHLYAGGVAGGVFESFDGAISWQPYDPSFTVNNISCITQGVDGSVYVGTGGHFEGSRTSTSRGYFFVGSGVHKLTGNGTFQTIIAPVNRLSPNLDYATVGEIVADPSDNNKLHVAMNNGYRVLTFDPGTSTWSESTPFSPGGNNFCTDIEVSADGQNIIVTFFGSIFVSNDGGATFNNTTPSGTFGRIEVDIAPSDKNIMYAGAARTSGCLGGIYRSQDGGNNWELIGPGGSGTFDMYANIGVNCQGYWDNAVAVYPDNSGKLLVGGVTLYRWEQSSVDPAPSNGSWNRLDNLVDFTPSGDLIPNYIHADKHSFAFDPRNSDVGYVATDGGITKSVNFNDPLPTFRVHNYKYGVTQYYGLAVNSKDIVMAGAQDNSTHLLGVEFNNNLGGIEVFGGDGFDAAMSVIDPSIGVASSQFNRLGRIQGIGTTSGNSNISAADIVSTNQFIGGLCASPAGCSRVFYNSIELWESFNHVGSTDSADIVEERKDLPPIKAGTPIEFRSNNNDIAQVRPLPNDVFPVDTLSASTGRKQDFIVSAMLAANNQAIINFDTISIDTAAKSITVNKYGGATETITYVEGVEDTYTNIFLDNIAGNPEVAFRVDTLPGNDLVLRIERAEIIFRYSYKMQDRVQAIFASANWPGAGANYSERNIFITRDLLKGKTDIVWHNVGGRNSTPDAITSTVLDMKFSNDGNYLFVGTVDGLLYRISDLDSVSTNLPQSASAQQIYSIQVNELAGKCKIIGRFPGRSVTDIAIDPNNNDNLIVALGNYGNFSNIARTTVATTTQDPVTAFEIINGSGNTQLPFAPSYAVMIDKDDPNRVLFGNELGVFSTDSAFAPNPASVQWTAENTGMGRVPVFEIRQMKFDFEVVNARIIDSLNSINNGNLVIDGQAVTSQRVIDSVKAKLESQYVAVENEGTVYIATHGRGVYQSDALVGLDENREEISSKTLSTDITIFPNPARDRAQMKIKTKLANQPIRVQIFNIRGQLVREFSVSNVVRGENLIPLDLQGMNQGTYIVRAIQADQSVSSKIIKQ